MSRACVVSLGVTERGREAEPEGSRRMVETEDRQVSQSLNRGRGAESCQPWNLKRVFCFES